jgi:hypothetical protein
VRGPQPAFLDLLLQGLHRPVELIDVEVQRLDRPDLLPHELPHPVQVLLKLRLGGEIPRHLVVSSL